MYQCISLIGVTGYSSLQYFDTAGWEDRKTRPVKQKLKLVAQYTYRVNHSAFNLSGCKRIIFVCTDDQIWQRIHAKSEVIRPIYRCYMQRQWTQMRLADYCLCKLYHRQYYVINVFSFYI